MASERDGTIPAIWAENAETTIPASPIPGTTYRNPALAGSAIDDAWPFREIIDSADFNQAMFLAFSLLSDVNQRGIPGWGENVDYLNTPGAVFGSDGVIYISTAPSGPNVPVTLARDPIDPANRPGFWTSMRDSNSLGIPPRQITMFENTGTTTLNFTYNPPAQARAIRVRMTGAGAGGQSSRTGSDDPAGLGNSGVAGGGGAWAEFLLTGNNLVSEYSIIIEARGLGGANTSSFLNGQDGGRTSLSFDPSTPGPSVLIRCNGGEGGGTNVGGVPGRGGTIIVTGLDSETLNNGFFMDGGPGLANSSRGNPSGFEIPGHGGRTQWGDGGTSYALIDAATGRADGQAPGGGGAGGIIIGAGLPITAGGNGATAQVFFEVLE